MTAESSSTMEMLVRASSPRERRRTRTRLQIQAEALRLFAQQGYDETTIEQIADASDISPRTFFRYFPTKEDVVLWDEYDADAAALLTSGGEAMPTTETLLTATRTAVEGLYHNDPERLLARHRLLMAVPALRAHYLEMVRAASDLIATTLAPEDSSREDQVRLRVTSAAILGAVGVALEEWERAGGKSDLLALLDQALDALVVGVGELRPTPRPTS